MFKRAVAFISGQPDDNSDSGSEYSDATSNEQSDYSDDDSHSEVSHNDSVEESSDTPEDDFDNEIHDALQSDDEVEFRGNFRCKLCPGRVLMSQKDLDEHVVSKKHKSREKVFKRAQLIGHLQDEARAREMNLQELIDEKKSDKRAKKLLKIQAKNAASSVEADLKSSVPHGKDGSVKKSQSEPVSKNTLPPSKKGKFVPRKEQKVMNADQIASLKDKFAEKKQRRLEKKGNKQTTA